MAPGQNSLLSISFRYWYWGHLDKLWFASRRSRRDVMLAVDLYVYNTYANMTVNINKERRNCPVLVYLPQLFGKGGGVVKVIRKLHQTVHYVLGLSVCLSAVRSTAHRDRKTNQCTHHSTDPLDNLKFWFNIRYLNSVKIVFIPPYIRPCDFSLSSPVCDGRIVVRLFDAQKSLERFLEIPLLEM